MKPSPQLLDWLDDRERQRLSQRASRAFTEAWDSGPVHGALGGAFAALREPDAEDVAAVVANLFADEFWVEALVEGLAGELAADPFFEAPFRHIGSDVHTGLVVFEDDHVSLAAGITRAGDLAAKKAGKRGRASIAFSGQLTLFKFVKGGAANFSFWECPPITDSFSAATAGRCRRTGERRIEDGETIVVDGRRQSFVIEHAAANLVVLQASIKPGRAPLAVEYDSETRAYVGCSAADDSASRIQMISTLLGKLDHAAAFPVIAAFLDHPNFFVRWHVMKELLGLDAMASLPHLHDMAARDPHPEARRAAAAVLSQLDRKAA